MKLLKTIALTGLVSVRTLFGGGLGTTMRAILYLIIICIFVENGICNPAADISSPIQEVRDKASAVLRSSYQSIPKSKWMPIVEKLKVGESKQEILKLLQPFNVTIGMMAASGQSYTELYQLDNDWSLSLAFQDRVDTLIAWELNPSVKYIWVAPPKDFTGKWITYFTNGQKSDEISYKDGRYFGEFISYHSDGSKCDIQHYSEKGCDGMNIGYFPSGKINYQGQYKGGKQVGTWKWFDEKGNVTSTQEHANY